MLKHYFYRTQIELMFQALNEIAKPVIHRYKESGKIDHGSPVLPLSKHYLFTHVDHVALANQGVMHMHRDNEWSVADVFVWPQEDTPLPYEGLLLVYGLFCRCALTR